MSVIRKLFTSPVSSPGEIEMIELKSSAIYEEPVEPEIILYPVLPVQTENCLIQRVINFLQIFGEVSEKAWQDYIHYIA